MTRTRAERVSEYFDFVAHPANRSRLVTRGELYAMLSTHMSIMLEARLHRRLWRWLRGIPARRRR